MTEVHASPHQQRRSALNSSSGFEISSIPDRAHRIAAHTQKAAQGLQQRKCNLPRAREIPVVKWRSSSRQT
jgi:hypothetical protein